MTEAMVGKEAGGVGRRRHPVPPGGRVVALQRRRRCGILIPLSARADRGPIPSVPGCARTAVGAYSSVG